MKGTAPDGDAVTDPDHRIGRMEFSVDVLKGFRKTLHVFDDIELFDEVGVDGGSIADETEDRLLVAFIDMDREAETLQPVDEVAELLPVGVLLQQNNHVKRVLSFDLRDARVCLCGKQNSRSRRTGAYKWKRPAGALRQGGSTDLPLL